jgi:hypothetical protein
VTGLLLLTPFAGAADPALLELIMPDARVVVSIDIARIRSSPLSSSFTNGVQNANPELQKLMDAAGFDPMRDLQEILFASPGIGKNPPALVVARGTFDTAKLRAFAESAGSKIADFGGVPMLSDPEKDSGAFALLDNIILAGNPEQVKAAIKRRGRGMILNTEMAMRVTTRAKRYDAWLVSIAPLATLADQIPQDTKIDGLTSTEMLRAIEQFSFGVSMNSDLTMAADVVMSNAKAAGEVADTLQMLMGTLQKKSQDQPSVMAALKNVSFGLDGTVVHLGFSVPAAEVERAMRDAMNPKTKTAGPLTASRQPVGDLTPVIQQAQRPQAVPMAQAMAAQPATPAVSGSVIRSARIPANGEILVQSSPKDMGTVVILGSKK